MRKLAIKDRRETDVTDEALYELSKETLKLWTDQGMDAPWMHMSFERFCQYINGVPMFVAQDAETGELLGMHCFRPYRQEGWCWGFCLAVAPSVYREGIASRMLEYEAGFIRQKGYRYMMGVTATTADWSIRWHLKNGYRIIGYCHSPKDNFANYVFRKQLIPISLSSPSGIAFVLRHPVYALHSSAAFCRLHYAVSYAIMWLTKDKQGNDNLLGKVARRMIKTHS